MHNQKKVTVQAAASPKQFETESMKKLRILREKIEAEFENEKKQRMEAEQRETITPMSLANDCTILNTSQVKKRISHTKMELATSVKSKIQGLKIEKPLQRELEADLERKSQEMAGLKQQNKRLREIIQLRQESNERKEDCLEKEITTLKGLMDDACMDSKDHEATMRRLRGMNTEIQEKAALLKQTIEDQAEADRLALIRTYRVRMRDVKHQLLKQEEQNLEGARAWIVRCELLEQDLKEAEGVSEVLDGKNSYLSSQNAELRVMQKHQDEQRDTLTHKVTQLKRENKRYAEHVARLEAKLVEADQTNLLSCQAPNKLLSRRKARPSIAIAALQGKQGLGSSHSRHVEALTQTRKAVEEMRCSLQKVRTAHIELLQERTELEIFLRQCVEDVRKGMYRFSVVNTLSRGVIGDQIEERSLLSNYGAKERKQLMEILESKLQVLHHLHEKMFPSKLLQDDVFDLLLEGDDLGSREKAVSSDVVELDMDLLWKRWKEWTRSVTPQ